MGCDSKREFKNPHHSQWKREKRTCLKYPRNSKDDSSPRPDLSQWIKFIQDQLRMSG
jgi:hypothetical protein